MLQARIIYDSLIQIIFNLNNEEDKILFGRLYHTFMCGTTRKEKGTDINNSIIVTPHIYEIARAFPEYKDILPECKPLTVWVQWGEEEARIAHEEGLNKETARAYQFNSREEANIFLKGIDEADGWNGYCTSIEDEQILFVNSSALQNTDPALLMKHPEFYSDLCAEKFTKDDYEYKIEKTSLAPDNWQLTIYFDITAEDIDSTYNYEDLDTLYNDIAAANKCFPINLIPTKSE